MVNTNEAGITIQYKVLTLECKTRGSNKQHLYAKHSYFCAPGFCWALPGRTPVNGSSRSSVSVMGL